MPNDPGVPRGTSESSETSQKSATPDYATWVPKRQAADAIGVSTKTVEQLAVEGQLQQASYRRPTGGPRLVVYHPADVARLARARQPEAAAFVLPAGTVEPSQGNGHGALEQVESKLESPGMQLALPPGDDPLRMLFAAAVRAVTSQSSQKSETLFVTLPEASALTGLSQAYLWRRIEAGTLKAVRDRGWRIRRRDLEAL